MAAPPIVDISALRATSAADVPVELVAAIDAACTQIGFFVVTGHAIEPVVDEAFRAAHALFALPEHVKESLAMVDRQGFVPARHRVLDHSLHSAPMEYYDVGVSGPQRWPSPDHLAGFEDTVRRYQMQVLGVAADLLRVLALALDLQPTFFADRMLEPQCFLRMMHYEPDRSRRSAPVDSDRILHPESPGFALYEPREPGVAGESIVLTDPHTDYGLITLLATDGVGGLEVRSRDGDWTMVTAPAGSLVVNLGDMLARWTNDRYVSTPHRVSAPAASDRFSVPFFVNPDPAATVSCLPSCVTDLRPCRYPPVTAGEFLAKRIEDGGYMSDAASEA